MIDVKDKSLCCGCTACKSVCPVNAIVMVEDEMGFLYPSVDPDKCLHCGLCDDICDFSKRNSDVKNDDVAIDVMAARHIDENIISRSQSGGVFTALTDVVLQEGGIIYGAVFNENFTVCHIRTENAVGRNRMRGSKYVQSNMDGVFHQVEKDLASGYSVLFSGTPCQVAGLKSYISSDIQDNLLTDNIICQGAPSPAIWKDYLRYRTGRSGCVSANFRDKGPVGWKAHIESFTDRNNVKKYYKTFSTLFYTELMHRDSCYRCPYNIFHRFSDITISDFWGVVNVAPEFDGPQGTSMIFTRTSKGEEYISKARTSLCLQDCVVDSAFLHRYNPNVLAPTRCPAERSDFVDAYINKGISYIVRRWGDVGLRYRAKRLLAKIKRKLGIQ